MNTETSLIEIIQALFLIFSILLCINHTAKSSLKIGKYFWFSSILIFFSALRRELSHIPYLFITEDALFLGKPYAWWEDGVLLMVTLVALITLYLGRRYLLELFKTIPLSLYVLTSTLVILQYFSENAIGFSHHTGSVVEEFCELAIYLISAIYLWHFHTKEFESDHRELENQSVSAHV